MSTHTLEPGKPGLHGTYCRELAPVLTIASGDRIRFRTLSAGWVDAAERRFAPRDPVRDRGHALCGPVAISGARPGDIRTSP